MSFATILLMWLALAAVPQQQFPPGEVVENVVSLSDPSQSYAVYLPSAYGPHRTWPVLFAMDPRGRARIPLDLFREAAERHGYIIVSSYNTASDSEDDLNTPAMQAMFADTPQLFFADGKRVYLTGFSGTAMVGWYFATQLGDRTAGLIGFGGGLPTRFALPDPVPFAFFGSAGRTDFNYDKMITLDADLEAQGAVRRFVSFDGAHQWGPAETCAQALDWMELQAMKSGRKEADSGLVEELYQERLITARELEEIGDVFGAFRQYRAMAEDFDGLRDIEEAVQKVAVLEQTDTVRDGVELRENLARRSNAYVEDLSRFLYEVRTMEELPRLDIALRNLHISPLKKQAAESSNPLEADAAQRSLEQVFVNASYYGPRVFLRTGEPHRTLLLLGIADAIKEENFNVLVGFARAYALAGDEKKAIKALQRADEIVTLQAAWLEDDPYLQALIEEPEFQALLRRR